MRAILLMIALAACGTSPDREPVPELETLDDVADAKRQHLVSTNLCGGWVTTALGEICLDMGDSLLFSGLALGVLTCEQAAPIVDAIDESQQMRNGYFVRYEPLAPGYKGNENSRDGITGLVFGLVRLAERCPSERPRVEAMWRRYRGALGANPTLLYPGNLNGVITPSFAAVLQLADHELVGGDDLTTARQFAWEYAAAGGVEQTIAMQDPCYSVHLVTLQAYLLGSRVSLDFKKSLCASTKEAGLALTDWYCGASDDAIKSWLSSYQRNQMVYRHQRCAWESESMAAGADGPDIDWLILYTLAKEGGR